MRGLASIFLGRQPEAKALRTGLLMLTCSDLYVDQIASRVNRSFPETRWTILKRNEPALAGFSGTTLFSVKAGSIAGQMSLLWEVRRQRYDIVILSCTNEPSFGLLKCMGVLSAFEYLCVVDENLKESILRRGNFSRTLQYLRRGFAGGWRVWRKRLFWWASWILSPWGFLYLLVRTGCLAARRVWNKNRAAHK
jgi:hypothetical protein